MSAFPAIPSQVVSDAPPLGAVAVATTVHRNPLRLRPVRVAALIVLIMCMSVADLYLTLTYLHGVGMGEANPVARWVMSFNCGWLLGLFKMALVGFTCGTLFAVRKRASAEAAAWLCAGVMVWLTFQWKAYGEAMPALMPVIHTMVEAPTGGTNWVRFE